MSTMYNWMMARTSYFVFFHVVALFAAVVLALYPPQETGAAGQQVITTTQQFTIPTYTRRLTIEVWGAGGGGGGAAAQLGTTGDGATGTTGGNTAVGAAGATTTANGGVGGTGGTNAGGNGSGGAGGTATGGDVNTSGSNGSSATNQNGADGGNPAQRGGTGNTGIGAAGTGGTPGGGGNGGGCDTGGTGGGGGGGGGGYSRKTYAVGALTAGQIMYAVIGTGGPGGSSPDCTGGGTGARGEVRVTWDSVVITSASTITSSLHVLKSISKGSGSFVIDHPLDPKNKLLYHSFVESPEMKNLYDGTATLDENGEATIALPDYFLALNREFRYLASGIGDSMPDLHLKRGVRREWFFGAPTFRIAGGKPGGTISWQVTGIRTDSYARANPIHVEVEKGPDAIYGKNTCLFEPLCEK